MTAIRIPTTPEIRRFNRAVEVADRLSGYRYDQLDPGPLAVWLEVSGHLAWARELELAKMDLPQDAVEHNKKVCSNGK